MSGRKLVSKTGRIDYRGLRCTGDNFVKIAVIARYLANDAEPLEGVADVGATRQNYSFVYEKTSDCTVLVAYVCCMKPKRKRTALQGRVVARGGYARLAAFGIPPKASEERTQFVQVLPNVFQDPVRPRSGQSAPRLLLRFRAHVLRPDSSASRRFVTSGPSSTGGVRPLHPRRL